MKIEILNTEDTEEKRKCLDEDVYDNNIVTLSPKNIIQSIHDVPEVRKDDNIIQEYFDSLDVRPKSKETYKRALKQFREFLTVRGVKFPIRKDILDYKTWLLEAKTEEGRGRFTACTVSSYLTAVKGFYVYLEAEGVSPNIANGIKGAKHQRGFRKEALKVEQVKKILTNIDTGTLEGKRNFAIINLLIRTGLRTIEIERANIEDIRQEGMDALLYIQGKGRDSKDDYVLLTDPAMEPLSAYLLERGELSPNAPLFVSHSNNATNKRLSTRSIRTIVKTAMKKAGIDDKKLSAHSLRHSAVTLSLMAGATIQEAQRMARHSNINTTMIYAHNIDRIKNAAERKIDKMLED